MPDETLRFHGVILVEDQTAVKNELKAERLLRRPGFRIREPRTSQTSEKAVEHCESRRRFAPRKIPFQASEQQWNLRIPESVRSCNPGALADRTIRFRCPRKKDVGFWGSHTESIMRHCCLN